LRIGLKCSDKSGSGVPCRCALRSRGSIRGGGGVGGALLRLGQSLLTVGESALTVLQAVDTVAQLLLTVPQQRGVLLQLLFTVARALLMVGQPALRVGKAPLALIETPLGGLCALQGAPSLLQRREMIFLRAAPILLPVTRPLLRRLRALASLMQCVLGVGECARTGVGTALRLARSLFPPAQRGAGAELALVRVPQTLRCVIEPALRGRERRGRRVLALRHGDARALLGGRNRAGPVTLSRGQSSGKLGVTRGGGGFDAHQDLRQGDDLLPRALEGRRKSACRKKEMLESRKVSENVQAKSKGKGSIKG
jgi:hypothetical protein